MCICLYHVQDCFWVVDMTLTLVIHTVWPVVLLCLLSGALWEDLLNPVLNNCQVCRPALPLQDTYFQSPPYETIPVWLWKHTSEIFLCVAVNWLISPWVGAQVCISNKLQGHGEATGLRIILRDHIIFARLGNFLVVGEVQHLGLVGKTAQLSSPLPTPWYTKVWAHNCS